MRGMRRNTENYRFVGAQMPVGHGRFVVQKMLRRQRGRPRQEKEFLLAVRRENVVVQIQPEGELEDRRPALQRLLG